MRQLQRESNRKDLLRTQPLPIIQRHSIIQNGHLVFLHRPKKNRPRLPQSGQLQPWQMTPQQLQQPTKLLRQLTDQLPLLLLLKQPQITEVILRQLQLGHLVIQCLNMKRRLHFLPQQLHQQLQQHFDQRIMMPQLLLHLEYPLHQRMQIFQWSNNFMLLKLQQMNLQQQLSLQQQQLMHMQQQLQLQQQLTIK